VLEKNSRRLCWNYWTGQLPRNFERRH